MVDVNETPVRRLVREDFAFAARVLAFGGVIGVASSILIARLYGIEVVGQYALATGPMGIVWFFSTVREKTGPDQGPESSATPRPEITGIFAAVLAFSVALTALMSIVGAGITRPALRRSH